MTVCEICGQISMVTIGPYCFECKQEIEEIRNESEEILYDEEDDL